MKKHSVTVAQILGNTYLGIYCLELGQQHVGMEFGEDGWGVVLESDIGKRVFLRKYGLAMENREQVERRRRNEARGYILMGE